VSASCVWPGFCVQLLACTPSRCMRRVALRRFLLRILCHRRCPPGSENRLPGQRQCEPCKLGSFRGSELQCEECVAKVAANTVTLEPGATNWTQCVCPPNFYANWTVGSGKLPNKAAGEECKPCDKDIVNCTRPGAFSCVRLGSSRVGLPFA
jgi:hypothetical protein